jgi:hypothetical protein
LLEAIPILRRKIDGFEKWLDSKNIDKSEWVESEDESEDSSMEES